MSGPWEKYQDNAPAEDAGPWTKYAPQPRRIEVIGTSTTPDPEPVAGGTSAPKSLPMSMLGDVDSQIGQITAGGYKDNPSRVEETVRTAAPRFAAGVAGGAKIIGQRVTPKIPEIDTTRLDADVADYKQRRDAGEYGTPGFIGEMVPEVVASGGPVGKTSTAVAKALPKALGAFRPAVGAVATNAAYEGGKAATDGGSWGDIGIAAGLGGTGAAVGHAVGGLAQRGAQPLMSDAAKSLLKRGVMPTYGAMLGRRASQAEEGLSYSPVVGGAVERARGRMAGGYAKAELDEGLIPIGGKVSQVGDRGAAEGKALIRQAYQTVTPHIEVPHFGKHYAVNDAVSDINANIIGLSPTNVSKLMSIRNAILRKGGNPLDRMDGETWKEMDSELGRQIRAATGPLASSDDKQFAEGVRIFKEHLRKQVQPKNGSPPDSMSKLKAADEAYRNYVPIHKATSKAMGSAGEVGEFNPLQMYRSGEQTRVGTGDLTRAGLEVISGQPPKSIGILRKVLQLGGNAGALWVGPASAAIWGGANLAYSRPVQSLVAKGIPGVNKTFEQLPFTAAQLGAQLGGRALPRALKRREEQ